LPNFVFLLFSLLWENISAQNNLLEKHFENNLTKDEITRAYVTPVKIIWLSDDEGKQVKNPDVLLTKFDGQLSTSG